MQFVSPLLIYRLSILSLIKLAEGTKVKSFEEAYISNVFLNATSPSLCTAMSINGLDLRKIDKNKTLLKILLKKRVQLYDL